MELDAEVARGLAGCGVEDVAGYAVFGFGHFEDMNNGWVFELRKC